MPQRRVIACDAPDAQEQLLRQVRDLLTSTTTAG
jgi:hypothetical protein